jgi:hypothetical protein
MTTLEALQKIAKFSHPDRICPDAPDDLEIIYEVATQAIAELQKKGDQNASKQ